MKTTENLLIVKYCITWCQMQWKGPYLSLSFSSIYLSFFWERTDCCSSSKLNKPPFDLCTADGILIPWRWSTVNVIWKQLAYSDFFFLAVFLHSWPFPLLEKHMPAYSVKSDNIPMTSFYSTEDDSARCSWCLSYSGCPRPCPLYNWSSHSYSGDHRNSG